MAAQDWFSYGISNPHASDDGVDLGTPDNTPVDFPASGHVIDASYHVYGGQVVVKPDGGAPWDEYAIHLNNIYVHDGDEIQAGQIIGTSGGGVGDLILKNGRVQPATSQSDYQGHSSGYHSEFGLFADDSAQGDMGQFNKGWGNPSRQMDPAGIIAAWKATHTPVGGLLGQGASAASSWPPPGDHIGADGLPYKPDGSFDKGAWIRHNTHGSTNPFDPSTYGPMLDPSNWLRAGLNVLGVDPANVAQRAVFGGLGVALVIVGAMTFTHSEGGARVTIQQAAGKLRKAAG